MSPSSWLRPPTLYLLALLGVGLVGTLDYASGSEISFSIFYLAPVALVAYRGKTSVAVLLSVMSAVVWAFLDIPAHSYSHWSIGYWNAVVRLAFFLIVTFTLSRLREQNEREKVLATTDSLTGVANGRAFYSILEMETKRLRRSGKPLTVAYLDVDGFKRVNDQKGHLAGDELLRLCADTMVGNVRGVDVVARLGGDEFVILFPETGGEDSDRLLRRVRDALAHEVAASGAPPITFSIGAIVTAAAPDDSEDLVRAADALMYRVKRGGKDGLLVEERSLSDASID
jgi:diguanylate cyclase (GGDEF)-like protein